MHAWMLFVACFEAPSSCARRAPASAHDYDHIDVTEAGVQGRYEGPEFVLAAEAERLGLRGTDLAHQFSNRVTDVVSSELRRRTSAGAPARVDLDGIRMTTDGMNGFGDVVYTLTVPIVAADAETATTAFEHRGGWGHEPEDPEGWQARVFKHPGAACSPVLRTSEGLTELWCQWRWP